MAELPAGSEPLNREQARGLEMPGDERVDAVAHQRRRTGNGNLQAQMCPRRALGQVLDFQQVPDHAVVGLGAEARILGQRDRILRARAIDHRAGHQDDPANAARSGRGEHRLGAANVEGTPGPRIGLRRQVQVGVDDHVHTGQPCQRRVPDVDDPPGHAADIATFFVDRNDPADQRRLR